MVVTEALGTVWSLDSGSLQELHNLQPLHGGEREHELGESLDDVEAGPDGDSTKRQRNIVDPADASHPVSMMYVLKDLR